MTLSVRNLNSIFTIMFADFNTRKTDFTETFLKVLISQKGLLTDSVYVQSSGDEYTTQEPYTFDLRGHNVVKYTFIEEYRFHLKFQAFQRVV